MCLNVKPLKIYIYKYIQNTKISMNFFIQDHFETEPAWMPSCLTKAERLQTEEGGIPGMN